MHFLQTQNGLETKISERGENFSGGQRQRLCLARALLADTPIYIFDEATSNIDMESEEMIMDVIRELSKTKTILFITELQMLSILTVFICCKKETSRKQEPIKN